MSDLPRRPKGPAALPPTGSKSEEFLKTIIPFNAWFDEEGKLEVIHIDKYLFVCRDEAGHLHLLYKAKTGKMSLDDAPGLKLLAHLAKP